MGDKAGNETEDFRKNRDFSLSLYGGLKWVLRKRKIFMPKNINSVTTIIPLEVTDKIKTENNEQKNSLNDILNS